MSGSLEIVNNTEIYNQNGVLNAFMSSLKINRSVIRDLYISNTPIRLTSSTLDLQDILVTNIYDNSENELLLINDESHITTRNLTYEHSTARLFRAFSSSIHVNSIIARNISNFDDLMVVFS